MWMPLATAATADALTAPPARPPNQTARERARMKPLIHGYLRVDRDAHDGDIRQVELALRLWAKQQGYCFARIFHEYDARLTRAGFAELTEEIIHSKAEHVIMPSLSDLSSHPLIRRHLLDALEDAGVQIHALREESTT
ncbi:hypothetical protein ACN27F_08775 [Solwaraspora sp. WMMB335]|uniref:hypothetical protein n=1 Tax=Solwaraspora sp. WMMB335 TaxID=3404118 RepID=UPI003B95C758